MAAVPLFSNTNLRKRGENEETVRFFAAPETLRMLADELRQWADEADAVMDCDTNKFPAG